MDAQHLKKELRATIAARRDAMSENELLAMSRKVQESLFTFEKYMSADTVMFFAAFRSEVVTVPMIEAAIVQGKRAVSPVSILETHELLPCLIRDITTDLAPGAYGIPEPPPGQRVAVDVSDIDFLCLPGLGFDTAGNRLGYGGGYYDRFMERLRPGCTLAALAFSFQIVDHVPHAPHDKPVQYIVTDQGVIDCSRA
jgi:5-formyltetrahydrofolate cyclo-ligase